MSYKDLKVNIIVAVADNLAIGRGNDMPWHLSEDLKYFKRTTSGHTVIMGRRTFESIGRPLPKRKNIVITRDPAACGLYGKEGIECVPSLEAAFEKCMESVSEIFTDDGEMAAKAAGNVAGCPDTCIFEHEVFIIGGGSIYAKALEYADRIYMTRIHAVIPDADTFFPKISEDKWKTVSSSSEMKDGESGLRFNFEVLEAV